LHSAWFWQIAWQSEAWEICSICSIRFSGSSQITPSVTSHGASVGSAVVEVTCMVVVEVTGIVVPTVVVVPSVPMVVVPSVPMVVVTGMVVPIVVSWQSDRRGLAGPLRQPWQGSTDSQEERR